MLTFEQKELIQQLVDLDSWKYSWHYNIYDADQKTINLKLKEIIIEKIKGRNEEIKSLIEGFELLSSLELKEDVITEFNPDDDNLPF